MLGVTFVDGFVVAGFFVSGLGGSVFGGGGGGAAAFDAGFRVAAGLAAVSGRGLAAGEAFDVLVVALLVLGAALVDFALVVVFVP